MKHFFLFYCMIFSIAAFSQSDTVWLAANWQPVNKYSAKYYSVAVLHGNVWHKHIFFAKSGRLHMKGYFTTDSVSLRTGVFKWYDETGWLSDSIQYENGIKRLTRHFYSNGQAKTYLAYNISGHATDVNSWYPDGRQKNCDTFYTDSRTHDCGADTAVYKGIITKADNGWHLQFYYMPDGKLYMDGWFSERLCRNRIGSNTWWYADGTVKQTELYENGRLKESRKFFENGTAKSVFVAGERGSLPTVSNWDSTGNKIEQAKSIAGTKPLIADEKAKFYKFLNKHLSGCDISKSDREGVNNNNVALRFTVTEDGSITEVDFANSSGDERMDKCLITAMKQYRSQPWVVDGKATAYKISIKLMLIYGKVM